MGACLRSSVPEAILETIDVAYRAAARIRFDGMQFRSDIGHKALDEV